ncbi:hypothetical protein Nmel_006140 [Mimus melanotis]
MQKSGGVTRAKSIVVKCTNVLTLGKLQEKTDVEGTLFVYTR